VKILKLWRTELSYAQKKNRGEKMRLLGMDTCPRLNDIIEKFQKILWILLWGDNLKS
jgi:hypothetical protein